MKRFWDLLSHLNKSVNQGKNVAIHGDIGGLHSLILFLLTQSYHNWSKKNVIVVYRNKQGAKSAKASFDRFFAGQTESSRSKMILEVDCWGVDRFRLKKNVSRERLRALSLLTEERGHVIFSSLHGLLQSTLSREKMIACSILVEVGQSLDQDELYRKILFLSYKKVHKIDDCGQVSMRGGILDVFPISSESPVRIEWFGDEIETIKRFDYRSQLSDREVESIRISPASECVPLDYNLDESVQDLFECLLEQNIKREDREGIIDAYRSGYDFPEMQVYAPVLRRESGYPLDYIYDDDIFLFLDSFENFSRDSEVFLKKNTSFYEDQLRNHRPTYSPRSHFLSVDELKSRTKGFPIVYFNHQIDLKDAIEVEFVRDFSEEIIGILSQAKVSERFPQWIDFWLEKVSVGFKIFISISSTSMRKKIVGLLTGRNFDFSSIDTLEMKNSLLAKVYLFDGHVERCAFLPNDRLIIIPDHEIVLSKDITSTNNADRLRSLIKSFTDMSPGDYVVHAQHGISKFVRVESIEYGGIESDFVHLEFAGKDRIFIPVDRLKNIQKYQGSSGENPPNLSSLKGGQWVKKKKKANDAAREIAAELLKAKARRKSSVGIAYSEPDELYYDFEAGFPFDETPDQVQAISETNRDLSQPYPMDRLICGDVGFGKTEVALRASMRVVLDGYQVLVVVPTTILCLQHHGTFAERFSQFGINVSFLNRFVSSSDSKNIIKRFKQGSLDILIGTHRVLSKNVIARSLGLLIVDEEQRFGVSQKETIHELAEGCDLLTLTATPIPRTLHMSMLGLKDVSLLLTAPLNRLPVETFLSPSSPSIVKSAINFELERNGQVFYLHNSVGEINEAAHFLKTLIPGIKVGVAHGQLKADKLEKVLFDFVNGVFSVLCCTTIIETGVDLPNVNTMIVNRAENFGLAQLYQLRGRVGRSNKQGYCYLFFDEGRRFSDEAKRRLDILSSHQDLGSGFKISNFDLEMRGAGNLLGAEQSGNIEGVGFDLFTRMLEEATKEIKGHHVSRILDPEIRIPFSASIPNTFISEESERLRLYRRLFMCDSRQAVLFLKNEIRDRFGCLPAEFIRICAVAELKILLRPFNAVWLRCGSLGFAEVQLGPLGTDETEKLFRYLKDHAGNFTILQDQKIMLNVCCDHSNSPDKQDRMLEDLFLLLEPLGDLC